MKRTWYVTASIALLAASVFVSATVCAMWAWWAFAEITPVYTPINPDQHKAILSNESITLHRQFVIARETPITITRELVRRENSGEVYKVALPPSTATYPPGEYKIARAVPLPIGLPPGEYEMHSTARWRANPVREGEVHLPVLRVRAE